VGALAAEDASGALAALEAELQKAIEAREAGEALGRAARAWLRLTESLFLEVLAWKGTGGASAPAGSAAPGAGPPHVLPRLLSQLQHAAVARDTHAALAAAVGALRAGDTSHGLPATLRRHITGDAHASAWEILVAGLPPVSIVLRGTETHVEGVRTDEPLDLGAAGVQAPPGWLAFWVADALCKHVVAALHRRAVSVGMIVVDGRRHIRAANASVRLRISGTATREGAYCSALRCVLLPRAAAHSVTLSAGGITWEVVSPAGAPVPVPWDQADSGASALTVLSSMLA
jgi:hypothetical protein